MGNLQWDGKLRQLDPDVDVSLRRLSCAQFISRSLSPFKPAILATFAYQPMLAPTVTKSIEGASYGQFENGPALHIILGAVDQSHCPRRIVDQCAFTFPIPMWVNEPSYPVLEGCGLIWPGRKLVHHSFDFLIFNNTQFSQAALSVDWPTNLLVQAKTISFRVHHACAKPCRAMMTRCPIEHVSESELVIMISVHYSCKIKLVCLNCHCLRS